MEVSTVLEATEYQVSTVAAPIENEQPASTTTESPPAQRSYSSHTSSYANEREWSSAYHMKYEYGTGLESVMKYNFYTKSYETSMEFGGKYELRNVYCSDRSCNDSSHY